MRRFVALLVHALGSTERRLGRSVSLGLALALTTAAWSSVFFLSESVRATGDALLEDAPLLTVQRLVAGRPALLDHEDAEALRALWSVRAVHERVWGYLYQPALEGNVVVIGVDPDASATLAEEFGFTDGTPLGDEEILVGSTLAATLGLRAGDRLALVGPTGDGPGETAGVQVLRVRAVLPAETAVSHGDTVLASMPVARALLGLEEGACVDLAIDVFPPEEANSVAARAIEAIPGARTLLRDALTRRRALTFEARAGLLSAVLLPLLLSFLVLTWDRLSGMGEDERREIGILKAVGWSTSDVLVCRLLESALIAGLGAALGLVLGYLHVFVLGAPGLSEAYFGWSNLRPAMALVPTLDPQVLVLSFTLVVLPFVAVSIVPAWRAATLDPDRAMRGPA